MANWWEVGEVVEAPQSPKARPDWGDGAVELPDGSIVRYGPRGGQTKLSGATKALDGAPPDIKEFQANAAARATLMDQGLDSYRRAVEEGYDPSDPRNIAARTVEGAWMVGPYLADVIRDNPAERARAAELQFVDGALRTTSGANAPEPEVVRANRAYFRQPGEGESAEPERAELRKRFRDQAVRIAGPAYIEPKSGAQIAIEEDRATPAPKPVPVSPEQISASLGVPRVPAAKPAAPTGQGVPRTKDYSQATKAQIDAAQPFRGSKQPSGSSGNPFMPVSAKEFDNLPVGAWFINPADGRVLQKGR